MGSGYLPLFRCVDYKLLLVMIRKKTEKGRLDSGFFFCKRKKGDIDIIG